MTNQRRHSGAAGERGRRLARRAFLGLLLLGLVIPVTSADAATAPPTTSSLVSGDTATGTEAVAALGDQLDEVAGAHDMTAGELKDELLTDDSLNVDSHDNLLYVEDPMAGPVFAPPVADGGGYYGTADTANLTEAQVFNLSSRPSSTRTIYLDFNGHVTTGTAWNSATLPTITTPAFSRDADPTTFTQDEINHIATAWASVAESYAAFDVNVTTKDPGVEALKKTTVGDTAYGIRVVIGPNTWYNPAGGVAYLGSFNWNSDTPAFVFSASVANNGKFMGDAAAHEVGHSFGLRHDGTVAGPGGTPAATGYYYGQGTWAPIMGVGYNKTTVQWSAGEYDLADNPEDDVATISSTAPYVPDLEGSPSSPVALGPLPASVGGIITTRTDVDTFSFATGGTFTVNVTNRAPNPTLDAAVTVRNAGGTVVATLDPAGVAAVSIPFTGPAGTYTVSIDGVGYGTALTTGYSDYASIGAYTLSITGSNPPVATPHAPTTTLTASTTAAEAPVSVDFTASATDVDGDTLTYSWDFGDGATSGGFVASSVVSHTYAAAGSYTATVTVKDPGGLTGSATIAIHVTDPVAPDAPVAAVQTSDPVAVAPAVISFSSAGTFDPQSRPLTFDWDFGDGTASVDPNPSKVYDTPGAYTATLTVANDLGRQSSTSVAIEITPNQAPVVVALAKVTTGYAPLGVQFQSTGSYDPEATALTYFWNSGEGHSSTSPNPLFVYRTAGNYTAMLTITDGNGKSTSKAIAVAVKAPLRTAATFSLVKMSGKHAATATVTVRDINGKPVRNAVVTGHWSGLVTGTGSRTTDAYGHVTFTTPSLTKAGTVTFSVVKVAPPTGWAWDTVKRSRSIAI